MPRDPRTYITVHDGMPDHPKIDPLSDGAFRLLISMWCWCSRNETDGRVPLVTWKRRGTPKTRTELVGAGLVEVHDDRVELHDYLEHQRSAAEIHELREKRRAAGSMGGKAKASAVASATAPAMPSAIANEKQTGSKSVADTDTDTSRHTSRSDSREDARFEDFWNAYPRRAAKPDAQRAWAKAVKAQSAEAIVAAARRYAADPNREDAYTAHPATWLNREGWNDPPLPPRIDAKRTVRATASPEW